MTWFEKIMPSRIKTERRTRSVPEGLWMKCSACDAVLYRAELERNLHVCPKCGHHMRIGARDRRLAPATAPAAGLYFWRVHYPAVFGLPDDSDIIPDPAGCPADLLG